MSVPIIVFVVALIMIACELRNPGRSFPKVAGWWWRATLLNGVQVAVVYLAGRALGPWLAAHRPWSTGWLGTTGSAVLGYLTITFVYYWWHRWRHEVPLLWRWLHQVHHSPQRLEVVTAFYKHPFEIVANTLISTLLLYLLGLDKVAAAYTVLLTGLAELFYHWNVSTPRWVGYFFQRPESHCVHHQDGLHHYNYSDLPLWDMLFGTFRNPARFDRRCGLGEEEHRLGEMLLGQDVMVSQPITGRRKPRFRAPTAKRLRRLLTARNIALGLLLLGSLRMLGDVSGLQALTGIGAASAASPAPKVFTAMDGMEPFSTRFSLDWKTQDGSTHSMALTPQVYARLRGPYNRRNAYGAVLAAAPVLLEHDATRPMALAVARHALEPGSAVLSELGVSEQEIAGQPYVVYQPIEAMPMTGLTRSLKLAADRTTAP